MPKGIFLMIGKKNGFCLSFHHHHLMYPLWRVAWLRYENRMVIKSIIYLINY